MRTELQHSMTTPVGTLVLSVRGEYLTGIAILTEAAAMAMALPVPAAPPSGADNPVLARTIAQLDHYFSGGLRDFRVPLDLAGLPPFTVKVLQTLLAVPYGKTVTYGELAARVGSPGAARAVGRAMAANPLPLVIPCHRVVAASGRLGGYSGGSGLRTKAWLLDFERSNCGLPKVFFKKTA